MFAGLWAKLIGALAVLGALFAALFAAKRSGEKQEQAAQTEQALKQAEGANAIDQNVRAMPAGDAERELRDKFSRD